MSPILHNPKTEPSGALVQVTFDESNAIPVLTSARKSLADNVELYAKRWYVGDLAVRLDDADDRGLILENGALVAAFTVAPLGGAR